MAFSDLIVCLLEMAIIGEDKKENLASLVNYSKGICQKTDLVVLPELFTTGLPRSIDNAHSLAERNTENTIDCISELAKEHNSAYIGSYLSHTAGKLFNRAFFLEPGGDEHYYDKHHIFSIGGENKITSPGYDIAPVVRYRGWNIKTIICYDLRFPVFCRNKRNEYDMLVVVANWPKTRYNVWKTLLAARAIENCCYVCGVNRRGIDEQNTDYGMGSSMIIDYQGNTIAETNEPNNIVYASLSLAKLNTFREKFPVWKDADEFDIQK